MAKKPKKMESTPIYKVTTEGDCEGRSMATLGYATGNPEDIKKAFESKKMYQIFVHETKLYHITPEGVSAIQGARREQAELEQQRASIDDKITQLKETYPM